MTDFEFKGKDLGEKVRLFRVTKNMSQEDLGKKLGMSKQTISKIEKGRRKLSGTELQKIAKILDTRFSDFLMSDPVKESDPLIHYDLIEKKTKKIIRSFEILESKYVPEEIYNDFLKFLDLNIYQVTSNIEDSGRFKERVKLINLEVIASLQSKSDSKEQNNQKK